MNMREALGSGDRWAGREFVCLRWGRPQRGGHGCDSEDAGVTRGGHPHGHGAEGGYHHGMIAPVSWGRCNHAAAQSRLAAHGARRQCGPGRMGCSAPWHQQSAHCESLRKTMIFALANPWRMVAKVYLRILANPCESLRNHELRKPAKACETLRNHICEFARKLAKACEIIFAKACKTQVFLRKHICESLQKYMHFPLAKPCESCES